MKRENLIRLRKERELLQIQCAERLGVSERQYARLESGESNGSVKIWEQLKHILNAPSIDYLLENGSSDDAASA